MTQVKAATAMKTDCQLEGSWGIVSMLKSLQTQLQRRHRQWCLKIDTLIQLLMFETVILSLLASTGNNVRASFLVHQIPHTSTTVWQCRRVFTQFSLGIGVSNYTCRPMIADLLYCIHTQVCTYTQGPPTYVLTILRNNTQCFHMIFCKWLVICMRGRCSFNHQWGRAIAKVTWWWREVQSCTLSSVNTSHWLTKKIGYKPAWVSSAV